MDLIIGAGVTGLSYANFTKNEYLILEMDTEIGGYCKTIKQDGFVWDYSGHFFHFNDEEIKSYIFERIDEQKIFTVEKKTQIFYKDAYIDFPFQKNIHQLPKDEFIDCLYDLYHRSEVGERTFKEMLLSKFGNSISEKFLIPYNEKLYACDLDTLDKDAMGRFLPYADIKDIVDNFKNQSVESYNSSFVYPEGGAIEYVKALAKAVDDDKIILNSSVIKIDVENKIVKTKSGDTFSYNNLITTMPFNKLLKLVKKIGLKRSGIVSTSHKIMVEIISSEILETPISKNNELMVEDNYLTFIIEEANAKLKRTHNRIKKLEEAIEKCLK